MVPEQSTLNIRVAKQIQDPNYELQRIRSENIYLRKTIENKLIQQFNLLKVTSTNQDFKQFQKKINQVFSEQSIQKLIKILTESTKMLQQLIKDRQQEISLINKDTDQNKNQLNQLKNNIRNNQHNQLKVQRQIDQKVKQLSQLQSTLEALLNEYFNLESKMIQKRHTQQSIEETNKYQVQQNWELETVYITTTIQQRASLRKRLSLLQKAKKLLEQKLINLNNVLFSSIQQKAKISDLKQKNQQLLNQLNYQKNRKQGLQEMKLNLIINKQSNLATNIVQRWDEQKRSCQNLLLAIIAKVNIKLPFKKLEDVNKIIQQAQNFYIEQQKIAQQNDANIRMEQHQPQQQQDI